MNKQVLHCSLSPERLTYRAILVGNILAISLLSVIVSPVYAGIPPGSLSKLGPLLRRALAHHPDEVTRLGSILGDFGSKRLESHFDRRIKAYLEDMKPGEKREIYEILVNPNVKRSIVTGASLLGAQKPTIVLTSLLVKWCAAYPVECIKQAKLASAKVAQRKYSEYRNSYEYRRDCGGYLPVQSGRLTSGSLDGGNLSELECKKIDEISRAILPSELGFRAFSRY